MAEQQQNPQTEEQIKQLQAQAQSLDNSHRIIGQLYTQLYDLSITAQALEQQARQLTEARNQKPPSFMQDSQNAPRAVPSNESIPPEMLSGSNNPVVKTEEKNSELQSA